MFPPTVSAPTVIWANKFVACTLELNIDEPPYNVPVPVPAVEPMVKSPVEDNINLLPLVGAYLIKRLPK